MTKKTVIVALAFGVPWGIFMYCYYLFFLYEELPVSILFSTLVMGLMAGLLFSLTMQYMGKRLLKSITVELLENEIVIKEGGANHFRGMEGVGGKLVLTDKRLIFKSHKINVQNHQLLFDLQQVKNVVSTKTLGLLKNGLLLELKSNEKHKFVVDEPAAWVSKIVNQRDVGPETWDLNKSVDYD